ncbi:MAG: hypothetical protein QW255_05625 [Candidatus Bilamarchaeaceae archaeon]
MRGNTVYSEILPEAHHVNKNEDIKYFQYRLFDQINKYKKITYKFFNKHGFFISFDNIYNNFMLFMIIKLYKNNTVSDVYLYMNRDGYHTNKSPYLVSVRRNNNTFSFVFYKKNIVLDNNNEVFITENFDLIEIFVFFNNIKIRQVHDDFNSFNFAQSIHLNNQQDTTLALIKRFHNPISSTVMRIYNHMNIKRNLPITFLLNTNLLIVRPDDTGSVIDIGPSSISNNSFFNSISVSNLSNYLEINIRRNNLVTSRNLVKNIDISAVQVVHEDYAHDSNFTRINFMNNNNNTTPNYHYFTNAVRLFSHSNNVYNIKGNGISTRYTDPRIRMDSILFMNNNVGNMYNIVLPKFSHANYSYNVPSNNFDYPINYNFWFNSFYNDEQVMFLLKPPINYLNCNDTDSNKRSIISFLVNT